MTVAELHDHQLGSVNRSKWRLTHTDARSLSYCRVLGGYRVVTVMALDDRQLTTQTFAWTDGADLAPNRLQALISYVTPPPDLGDPPDDQRSWIGAWKFRYR